MTPGASRAMVPPSFLRRAPAVLAALVVAACRGVAPLTDDDAGETDEPVLPMPERPAYALHRAVDYSSGFLMAEANYGQRTVYCYRPCSTVSRGDVPPTVLLKASAATCQGVAVGRSSAGQAFVLVVLTDFRNARSTLQMWRDVDGDALPERGTRTDVATLDGVHLTDCVYDKDTGTLYATDALNDAVLRFADTTGDRVPDARATTFARGLGVRHLAGAEGDRVRVYDGRRRGDDLIWEHPQSFLLCVDTDGDGIADSITARRNEYDG